jgi:cation diffusion facilitator family transporter
MKECCDAKSEDLRPLRQKQSRVLKWVLGINAGMFVVEAAAGLHSGSAGLLADGLEMFSDAAVYALTLWVLDRGTVWKARAALVKGILMAIFGVGVLARAGISLAVGAAPEAATMGLIGALALAANLTCLLLLLRHRSDDLNMRSTWLCSRNDILSNTAVLIAAGLVARFNQPWPDAVAAAAIAGLCLKSAVGVIGEATRALNIASRQEPASS